MRIVPAAGGGGGVAGPGGRNSQAQFLITTNIVPRKPAEYRHKLTVTAPVAPVREPDFDPGDGGPIGGPADPDDGTAPDREDH